MTLSQQVPAVPDGSPAWVYVVAAAAGVLVVLIGAAPSIIEKLRSSPATKPPPSTGDSPGNLTAPLPMPSPPGDSSPPTDTLRAMILDLQGRLTRSEQREDTQQERLLEMTRKLATAEAEIAALRSQVQMMTMRRD
jgi:hypothetical protein